MLEDKKQHKLINSGKIYNEGGKKQYPRGKIRGKKAQQSKTSPWVGLQQLRILQVWKQY